MLYDKCGEPDHGVVISRDPDGNRVLALVPKDDSTTLAFLTDGHVEPVGTTGRTTRLGDVLRWEKI